MKEKSKQFTKGIGGGLGSVWTMAIVLLIANYWVKSIPSWIIELSTWLFFAGLVVIAAVFIFGVAVISVAKHI